MFSRISKCSSSGRGRLRAGRNHPRGRCREADGFSLIELLVVVLIIGILSAIAIPAFAGQKSKASDAQAKELVRTAETTAETISVDNNGEYSKVSAAELNRYEPSIRIVTSTSRAYLSATTAGKGEYTLTATAPGGDEFTVTKNSNGGVTRSCSSPITKTGCAGGATGSW